MNEKTAEKKPCAFSGRAVYNENAIKAFCKVQYSAFKKKNQILIVLLGIALIVLAVCGLTKGAASIDGKFGTSKYSFDDKGFDIVAGSDTNRLGYDNMIRLIEDSDYFFFFATPQLAYIVEKKTLDPKSEEKFKAYTSRRVGLEWTSARPWYSLNLKAVINDKKNTRKIPK